MARTQAKILTTIWADPDWLALSSAAKSLYFLVLSQPRLNIAGCLDVMPARWARLSPDTTEADVIAGLDELVAAAYVVVDRDELVVRTFTTHDLGHGTLNGNLVKGMWSAWAGIMSPRLRKVVVDQMPVAVFERAGVEVPEEAARLRSEPRLELPFEPQFDPPSGPTGPSQHANVPETISDQGEQPQGEPQYKPQLEPQSEPSVDCLLLPVTCSLLVNTPPAAGPGTGLALVADELAPATPSQRYSTEFETWWAEYPRKVEKAPAAKAYTAARRTTSAEHLLDAVKDHARAWTTTGTEPNFIVYPERWLKRRRYDEAPEAAGPPKRPTSRSAANAEKIRQSVERMTGGTP